MSSNTGDSVPEITPPTLLTHGIDTVNYHIALDTELTYKIVKAIENGDIPDFEQGAKGVSGYAYSKTRCNLTVRAPSNTGGHMGLYVTANSFWCHSHAPQDYEQQLSYEVSEMVDADMIGIEIPSDEFRLKRVDPHFDIGGIFPDVGKEQIISNARKRAIYLEGTMLSNVQIGTGDIVFRLYDKTVEARENGTTGYWSRIWGKPYDHVWRVEYQLRKRVLKKFGITDINGFLSKAKQIMDYLLNWVRFAEVQVRKDQARPLLLWWQLCTELISAVTFGPSGIVNAPPPNLPDETRLAGSLIGMAATYAALLAYKDGLTPEDNLSTQDGIATIVSLLKRNEDTVLRNAQEKLLGFHEQAHMDRHSNRGRRGK
jgi:hypothetical protein